MEKNKKKGTPLAERWRSDTNPFKILEEPEEEAKKTAVAKTFSEALEILKFNPYHDSRGRFASANGYASFTYSPGKSKAHDMAIAREKERQSQKGGSAEVHSPKEGKITYESGEFGQAGTYVVYRNGAIGNKGMLFFSPKKETADSYAFDHGDGNTTEYEVQVKNPLVIRGVSDASCVSRAYRTLNPDKPMSGSMTEAKWKRADKANAAKIGEGKEYDAILYEVNGKPHELLLPAKDSSRLQVTGEYTTTKWSKLGWTMEEAKSKGYYDRDPQDYQKVTVGKSAAEETESTDFSIYKTDDDKRLVFGWASIAITVDGEQLEDRQKDMIDPEDLEEAVYDYVLNFRDTGEEHIPTMRKKGKLVESCVFTAEKQKAIGIPEGTLPIGWWIGFKIEDDAAWERVKNGTYKMFSIEGKANREPVEKSRRNYDEYPEYGMWLEENLDATIEEQRAAEAHYQQKRKSVAKTFSEILKANPYHGADGKFTTAAAGGGIVPNSKKPQVMLAIYERTGCDDAGTPMAPVVDGEPTELCLNTTPYAGDKLTKKIWDLEDDLQDRPDVWTDEKSPFKKIEISKLKSTQTGLSRENLEGILESGKTEFPGEEICVIKMDKQLVIVDGNHRVALATLAGHKSIKARVYDADKYEKE